jgi:hypothetical protein
MVVRVVDGGGLENRWVNSPGGSNPSPSEVQGRKFDIRVISGISLILRVRCRQPAEVQGRSTYKN